MDKIAVVICYFGTWPRWMNLFLESCRRNPTVDFLLVNDCGPLERIPDNVKLVDMDLPRFSALASERLGFAVKLQVSRKLADFKPAYGALFADLLQGYDFWAYADLDVVYGDLRRFLTPELLAGCDVLSTRREFIAGHFTLMRNTPAITRLFERSRDYQRVFQSPRMYAFDECGWGLHQQLLRGAKFEDVAGQSTTDCMMHVMLRSPEVRLHLSSLAEEHMDLTRRDWIRRQWQMRWQDGKLFDEPSGREVMYFHFHLFKALPGFYFPRWQELPASITITPKGFESNQPAPWPARLATGLDRWRYSLQTHVKMQRYGLRMLRRRWARKLGTLVGRKPSEA